MLVEKEKMVFLDEYGCQVFSRHGYGYSEKVTPAHKKVPQIRTKNYSVCAAMKHNSLFYFRIQDKPYNADNFKEFLNELFYWLDETEIIGAYLIMDNVRFHKTDEVKELCEERGKLRFL